MREGSYTLVGEDDRPEQDTAVAHLDADRTAAGASRRSVEHRRHGRGAKTIDLPNLFGLARAHGYTTAAFFSKPKFQPLQVEGTLDYSQAPGGLFGGWSSDRTMSDVATYLGRARPNVLFVHLKDPDAAGHRSRVDDARVRPRRASRRTVP